MTVNGPRARMLTSPKEPSMWRSNVHRLGCRCACFPKRKESIIASATDPREALSGARGVLLLAHRFAPCAVAKATIAPEPLARPGSGTGSNARMLGHILGEVRLWNGCSGPPLV
jgi:hypothetical protein